MSRIAIYARSQVHPGKADEFGVAFAHVIAATRDEPGTLSYGLQRSNDDPDVFWTTELYADDTAFEAHRTSPAQLATRPMMKGLVAGSTTVFGEQVLGKDLLT